MMKRPNSQELREIHTTICQALAIPTKIALPDALDIMFAIKDRILAHQKVLMATAEKNI